MTRLPTLCLLAALSGLLGCPPSRHTNEPPPVRSVPTGATPPRPSPSTGALDEQLGKLPLRDLADPSRPSPQVAAGDLARIEPLLWRKYCDEVKADPGRAAEDRSQRLQHDDAVMRFEVYTSGERPPKGYPLYIALHGGGGAPASVNDAQWRDMQSYYRASVRTGLYVAPRGVSNTWNLHFRSESYALYQRLIENMIVFRGADPNRVYLLGFSAGGDGVYQIAPRLASRLAAASMSAGHPNGVRLDNLQHLPFLLQVGERDQAYGRNKAGAEYCEKLRRLRQLHPTGYAHDCFIHHDRPHNFADNDPSQRPQRVLADPVAWLGANDRRTVDVDTNAVAWLSRHVRDPFPDELLWDLRTRAPRQRIPSEPSRSVALTSPANLHYWLDLGDVDKATADRVQVRLDRKHNAIHIDAAGSFLRILIHRRMLDLERVVLVSLGGETWRARLRPTLRTMVRTLLERGDPTNIFACELVLQKDDQGRWKLSGEVADG